MPTINTQLFEANSWWNTGKLEFYYKDREIYKEISKYLNTKQIVCITGLRRTGKSTILKKIIQDKLIEGFDSKNILYFSFDELRHIEIRDVINEYKMIFNINKLTDNYLFVFDEIQKLEDWDNQLKTIYDIYPNIKIIISGSESTFIRKKTTETLAGRMYEFKINPLSFKEFIIFKEKQFDNVNLYSQELKLLFLEYLKTQGFPELINAKDKEQINKYLTQTIINKVIYDDVIANYKIKNLNVISALFNIIIDNPGQIIDISNVSKELSVSKITLQNYLQYMEDCYFIKKIYAYSNNQRTSERKQKKYYPLVVSSELSFSHEHLIISKAFESLIVTQLDPKFFWRDKYKHEIDVILINDKNPIPIEIKYGKVDSYDSIKAFLRKYKLNELTVITFEKEETVKLDKYTIKLIPAYKYFLEN